jgi:ribosomal protein S18 acetylase RimI-like enzyme
MQIRPYDPADQPEVIALWRACGLTRPWNDPARDIERKLTVQPELFLVGIAHGRIVGTVMAGYDGHRGWINYLAVEPASRRQGRGQALMHEAQQGLSRLGCPKINLQVRAGNAEALAFYQALGYDLDDVVSLGKRLEHDDGSA